VKTIAFFNNKGGDGTTLVYHLAWMYAHLGLKVVAADVDPLANLTSMFLAQDRLEELWPDGEHPNTLLGAIQPILKGIGDVANVHVEGVADNVGLIVGDLGLTAFEENLSDAWPRCLVRHQAAFLVTSAFHRLVRRAAQDQEAEIVLIDVASNLGAINRAAMIASEYLAIPLAPDLFSLQGLRNVGPTLRRWRSEWQDRRSQNSDPDLDLPVGGMQPAGYVFMQHALRLDRPVLAYSRWMERIPRGYATWVLGEDEDLEKTYGPAFKQIVCAADPNCLALLKDYRSLMPMAMEAHKPMFFLVAADGVVGAHYWVVQECYHDFRALAIRLAKECHVPLPS
jgi:chromosome partitioning protein